MYKEYFMVLVAFMISTGLYFFLDLAALSISDFKNLIEQLGALPFGLAIFLPIMVVMLLLFSLILFALFRIFYYLMRKFAPTMIQVKPKIIFDSPFFTLIGCGLFVGFLANLALSKFTYMVYHKKGFIVGSLSIIALFLFTLALMRILTCMIEKKQLDQ